MGAAGRRRPRDRDGGGPWRRPVAGKTGTAQEYTNAWFCGYVPQLAACVWVGYPEGNIPMSAVEGVYGVTGGSIPAAIWHDFMAFATRGMPVRGFPPPSLNAYDAPMYVPLSTYTVYTPPSPPPEEDETDKGHGNGGDDGHGNGDGHGND